MDQDVSALITEIKKDNDFFQKAKKLLYLKIEKHIRVKDLAEALDMKPAYLCHILRLNKLPEIVRDGYYSKTVSLSHLFIIARLKNVKDMTSAYEKVLGENLTAIQTEGLIREMLYDVESGGEYISREEVARVQEKLSNPDHDYQVKLVQTRVRGKLTIEVKGGLTATTPAIHAILKKLKE